MSEWIGVKEKLPDVGMAKNQDTGWLVYKPNASRKIETCFVHPDWWWQDDGSSQEITHWMPLPESPVASNNSFDLTKTSAYNGPIVNNSVPASNPVAGGLCRSN